MAEASYILFENRGVLEIAGEDRRSFLQGLISNDTHKLAPNRALYAALLTAQGKYLHDFFLAELGDAFYLDGEAVRLADLQRRLTLYKLRAKVTLGNASDRFAAGAVFGKDAPAIFDLPSERGSAAPFAGGIAYIDPRLAELGVRLILPRATGAASLAAAGPRPGDPAAYDLLRLSFGVPDGSLDLEIEKTILLEAGFDELNGVDWNKGCYVGQELTARTKYRGLIKKRLLPVTIDGPLPEPGTPIMFGGQEAGEIRSGRDNLALALLRLEALEQAAQSDTPLTAGTARVTAIKPTWAKF